MIMKCFLELLLSSYSNFHRICRKKENSLPSRVAVDEKITIKKIISRFNENIKKC